MTQALLKAEATGTSTRQVVELRERKTELDLCALRVSNPIGLQSVMAVNL